MSQICVNFVKLFNKKEVDRRKQYITRPDRLRSNYLLVIINRNWLTTNNTRRHKQSNWYRLGWHSWSQFVFFCVTSIGQPSVSVVISIITRIQILSNRENNIDFSQFDIDKLKSVIYILVDVIIVSTFKLYLITTGIIQNGHTSTCSRAASTIVVVGTLGCIDVHHFGRLRDKWRGKYHWLYIIFWFHLIGQILTWGSS